MKWFLPAKRLFYCVIFGRAKLRHKTMLKNSIKIARHGREWKMFKIWVRFSFLRPVSSIMFRFCTTAILRKKLQHHACLNTFLTLHCKTSLHGAKQEKKVSSVVTSAEYQKKYVKFIKLIYIFHALRGSFVGQVTRKKFSLSFNSTNQEGLRRNKISFLT